MHKEVQLSPLEISVVGEQDTKIVLNEGLWQGAVKIHNFTQSTSAFLRAIFAVSSPTTFRAGRSNSFNLRLGDLLIDNHHY